MAIFKLIVEVESDFEDIEDVISELESDFETARDMRDIFSSDGEQDPKNTFVVVKINPLREIERS